MMGEKREKFLIGCFLGPRDDQEGPMFWDEDGDVGFALKGYAIIPVEEYRALIDHPRNDYHD